MAVEKKKEAVGITLNVVRRMGAGKEKAPEGHGIAPKGGNALGLAWWVADRGRGQPTGLRQDKGEAKGRPV